MAPTRRPTSRRTIRAHSTATTLRQTAPPPPQAGEVPRHPIVAPSLRVADAAAASVFSAARARGPIARDVIAQVTQLSIATVNRQVTALLDAGVLRERADLAVSGAIGRPRVPVEVNHEPFLTLGIHIGARTTSIVATDLFGRTLDVVETPTPRGAQAAALASLAGSARRYLSRWHRRRPLWVGVAAGGVVDRPPDTSTTRGWAGPMRPSVRCWPRRSGCRCPLRRTSTRWPGPSCCWACAEGPNLMSPAGGSIDEPVRLCPRNRGLRPFDRRAGALAGQRAGHHRRPAGPLGAAWRHRPTGVDSQRRGGADRGAQLAHHPG